VQLPPGTPDLAAGARVYQQLCLACHGDRGQGGQLGPTLQTIGRDFQAVANVAWAGRGGTTMPAFNGTLTLEQLRDVAHYISGRLFDTGHTN
jgi:mono/diheme cytochrome c family protein